MSALVQLVLGEELVRGDGLELLPFALPLGHCMPVRLQWLDLSSELCPGVTALEKRDVLWLHCDALCNAKTTVTGFPLLG